MKQLIFNFTHSICAVFLIGMYRWIMNKLHVRAGLLLLVALILILPGQTALSQQQLGEVLALRVYENFEGDETRYEQLTREVSYPFFAKHASGLDYLLLKADRGNWEGRYLDLLSFESLDSRNTYFPTENSPYPEWQKVIQAWDLEVDPGLLAEFSFNPWTGEGMTYWGDYVFIGESADLPEYGVLGLHHIGDRSGREAEIEDFIRNSWNPARLPGQKADAVWFKADRGPRKGHYLLVFTFESAELRDMMVPEPEGDTSDMGLEMLGDLLPVMEQLRATFDTGGSAGLREYSDFVLIR